MQKDGEGLTVGVLDIYGFEIFMVSDPIRERGGAYLGGICGAFSVSY